MIFSRIIIALIVVVAIIATLDYFLKLKISSTAEQPSLEELEKKSNIVKKAKKEIKGEIDQTQKQLSKIKNNLKND